jgi:hypothetical protein
METCKLNAWGVSGMSERVILSKLPRSTLGDELDTYIRACSAPGLINTMM